MPRVALSGSRIRERRLAAGLRQGDVARAAGISASYLNLIEHNRRRIGGKRLADLARALGCAPEALTEGGEAALIAALREAAAADGAAAERAEDLAGRFPGWAAVLAGRQARIEALEQSLAALSDRLAHDPALAAALHELLTATSAIRATASILTGTEALDPAWLRRFLGNLDAEGRRLADGAQALVRYLEGPVAAAAAPRSPQEEVEAFLAAQGWHLAPLEATGAGPEVALALADAAPGVESAAGRALPRGALLGYLDDARALPLATLAPVAAEDPWEIAARLRVPPDLVLRRLAALPGREAGLVVVDAAGGILFSRPLAGFAVPRRQPACPLWPVFRALSQPAVPISTVLEMPGPAPRRIRAAAIALPTGAPQRAQRPAFRATMLLSPAPAQGQGQGQGQGLGQGLGLPPGPAEPVGPACRICPRDGCDARREPSALAGIPA